MSILTDAQKLQVNAADRFDSGFITAAFTGNIFGHTVGQVGIGFFDIDLVKKVVIHIITVRILILSRQADVFIQIEAFGTGKIQRFFAAHPRQFGVNRFHSGAGRQTEDHFGVIAQGIPQNSGGQFYCILLGRLDNNFHFLLLRKIISEIFILFNFCHTVPPEQNSVRLSPDPDRTDLSFAANPAKCCFCAAQLKKPGVLLQ